MWTYWQSLERSLSSTLNEPETNGIVQGWRRHSPHLQPYTSASSIVEALRRRETDPHTKTFILNQLIGRIQTGKRSQFFDKREQQVCWAVVWLGFWPGLDGIYRREVARQCAGSAAADAVASELVLCFTTSIVRLNLRNVNAVPATLYLNTLRSLVDRRQSDRRHLWNERRAARSFSEGRRHGNHLDAVEGVVDLQRRSDAAGVSIEALVNLVLGKNHGPEMSRRELSKNAEYKRLSRMRQLLRRIVRPLRYKRV